MKCTHCDQLIERNNSICPHCGRKQPFINPSTIVTIVLSIALFFMFYSIAPFPTEQTKINDSPTEYNFNVENEYGKTELVERAQQTVYTVYTPDRQGSAFLYNDEGAVITNAHVVEGSLTATITTEDGPSLTGTVIGYSNHIDVALLSVPALRGQKPFPIEADANNEKGDAVVALGTPLGLENRATFGHITGLNRNFYLSPHTFTDVYQISAPIEFGSSGGPLISMEHQKIIAMNAAKHTDTDQIAYSIPIHQILPLVDKWIKSPLTEAELTTRFYKQRDYYYNDFLLALFDTYYFDSHYLLNEQTLPLDSFDDHEFHKWIR